MSNLKQEFGWFKADKPYPTKCSNQTHNRTQNTKKTNNPFEIHNKINESLNSTSLSSNVCEEEKQNKISMKDLCVEDKQRIANLVKELARIGDEKNKLEKCLEDERKLKDKEVNEILLQQEVLLNEKEKLLNKFSKTQEKLDQLKRVQKKANQIKVNNVPKPDKITVSNKIEERVTKLKVESSKDAENQKFNPHKSSTPRDLSPVEEKAMPITQINNANESVLENNHIDDMKKIDLMKQRMDLLTEQQDLRKLLEQQESLFKEKQNQILIQQQVHKERLEELNQIKLNNQNELNTNNNNKFKNEIDSQYDLHSHQNQKLIYHDQIEINNLDQVPQRINNLIPNNNNKFTNEIVNQYDLHSHQNQKLIYNDQVEMNNPNRVPQRINDLVPNNNRINSCSNLNLNSMLYELTNYEDQMNHQSLNNFYANKKNMNVQKRELPYLIEPNNKMNGPINYIEDSPNYEQHIIQNHSSPYFNQNMYIQACQENNADKMQQHRIYARNQYNHVHLNPNLIPQKSVIPNMNLEQNDLNLMFMNTNINENQKKAHHLPKQVNNIIRFDLIDNNLSQNENRMSKFADKPLEINETESAKKRYTGYETGYETDDMEESKLIEDLFFIK